MTNRERLAAMSDEDLAEFLLQAEQGNLTVDVCDPRYCVGLHRGERCSSNCTDAVVAWLRGEADE